ncbi:UDP-N-acetylmuramoyl-L-alanine--D-glutamate ligase [Mycobacterium marinum]|uniref:UDP-N-acetylmuramoylalanine--D-glutamate ligase n=1 Tax=Mycobacterium marinum (strain ATCC BAA-535 / M) TaxID=216594 RepID=B2HGR8_MYCMM|nr:UDP-N-acetylmuramoyl-L-alanine--D-glutamate ligase [Mycobacterium marinum]ACC41621.1 UDP-N-acetylmuramoylalanine-D-glutamate ligase MurD [Mycobacterium marinum M]EPQ76960.1 UDP-N-acetylmuramoylalanine--D-glutamate ligase [Mycobacterium marinum MB2]MDC8984978.1 UDP-N-acetylmuramoyl-L-alanine--D-glutamate ligase [Mycobacterium marinum]MDC9002224.1 UDP-N-acetylmuramoyl-L-alanine--D-glutamate ligase [Mycobacterium marinum]MDC9013000.1 UDP-N-acetylmuramoyl-L-alanine--D-glutamate ligase [Mycobact
MLDPLVPGAPVLVAGARVTGRAVLAALTRFGAIPTMCDDDPAMLRPFAESGVATVDPSVAVQQLAQPEASPESRYALVVTSPGFQPSTPVLAAAAAAGVPIWGDVELAWRLDAAGCYGPPRRWLVVTGTNGKTTTTSMLHAMLVAGQHRSVLCGNIGSPVLDVLEEPADLLAVELSSFQLHWAPSLRPEAGVVLNIAEDHLDWHGTMAAYTEAKARVLTGRVAVVGLDDSRAAALRDTAPAPVRVGFRIGAPAVGELGLRDGHLVDRAFSDDLVLLPASSIPVPGPVGVLDTLAAAALARAVGVSADAIADAVASFQVGRHRSEVVEVVDGITYVDDSKATNPHAAEASVLAYPRVVWVAGGLLKGASVDAEVARMASRLVGAVLIGQDRAEVAEALSRHAPDVPVVQVVTSEDADMGEACGASVTKVDDVGGSLGARVMRAAVAAARNMARSGDTVLLAPAGASFDQFTSYGDRGDAFAAAVRAAVR